MRLQIRPRQFNKGRMMLIAACAVWILAIAGGFSLLWGYENTSGPNLIPPSRWPLDSSLQLASDRATLIMVAHPHCPCTRASIGELARLMAQAQGRVTAYALFVKPDGASDDWEKTDLWQSAASIPDVKVVIDTGIEAQRFQAVTSGQTVLYDAEGQLLFSGGITGSRGHAGDNAGRSAIVSLLNTGVAERAETAVFGCPLFDKNSTCRESFDDRKNP
jgi:hypothetical protein